MRLLEAEVSYEVILHIQELLSEYDTIDFANQKLFETTGVIDFFFDEVDFLKAKNEVSNRLLHVEEHNVVEYGDFQTNESLAATICSALFNEGYRPTVIVEPTCGKGNLLLAALRRFSTVKHLYGIEIYKPYLYQCKFNILNYYLEKPQQKKPTISLFHANVFDVSFDELVDSHDKQELLVLGNPPWVTNATLGRLSSGNLPAKSNFKQLGGLDALTGKSNFDIAEFITIQLLSKFQFKRGHLALLVKNSVIKNIVYDQIKTCFRVGNLKKQIIDAKKEFDVSVDASLLSLEFNKTPALSCIESVFNDATIASIEFGWIGSKFVSNKLLYEHLTQFDGQSYYEWRQGLKHDCSAVMELDKVDDYYISKIHSTIDLEEDLVFPLYKSSDLQQQIVGPPRKYVIVTQKRVGQDTAYIRELYPLTYRYLQAQQVYFDKRKSSIYNGKPPYSIFGIGDYSFKPYKVAISSLYKEAQFALVSPVNGKPAMLDDTCYSIGFDKLTDALFSLLILNHSITRSLLRSLTFSDAKRVYTKDVLSRIDIFAIAQTLSFEELTEICPSNFRPWMNQNDWVQFINSGTKLPKSELRTQLSIF